MITWILLGIIIVGIAGIDHRLAKVQKLLKEVRARV